MKYNISPITLLALLMGMFFIIWSIVLFTPTFKPYTPTTWALMMLSGYILIIYALLMIAKIVFRDMNKIEKRHHPNRAALTNL